MIQSSVPLDLTFSLDAEHRARMSQVVRTGPFKGQQLTRHPLSSNVCDLPRSFSRLQPT
jgi:hypothetical protein